MREGREGREGDEGGSRPGAVSLEGTVVEALPHGLFRVVVERQQRVTAHVPSGPGPNFVRVLIGDRVRVELSPRDRTRGRIVERVG